MSIYAPPSAVPADTTSRPTGPEPDHRTTLRHLPELPAPVARLVRFAAIGGASTVLYLALYVVLAPTLRPQGANAVALLLSALANTAANRRYTFGVRGRSALAADHGAGLAVFALGLAITSGTLGLLHAAASPSRTTEVAALVMANLVVTALRFVALRWIFARTGRARSGDRPVRDMAAHPFDSIGTTSVKDFS